MAKVYHRGRLSAQNENVNTSSSTWPCIDIKVFIISLSSGAQTILLKTISYEEQRYAT